MWNDVFEIIGPLMPGLLLVAFCAVTYKTLGTAAAIYREHKRSRLPESWRCYSSDSTASSETGDDPTLPSRTRQ